MILCKQIENVNSVPSQSSKYLKKLTDISNEIKNNLHIADQNLNKTGTDESNKATNDQIEYFIQNAQMIAETQNDCQDAIVKILVKIGHLTSNKFGIRCFEALQDLMKSSKTMLDLIK
jgi:tartrate dehydratase alpha subunit/fumarate hydratase class I-like protein